MRYSENSVQMEFIAANTHIKKERVILTNEWINKMGYIHNYKHNGVLFSY
jgi:hypothetical protein